MAKKNPNKLNFSGLMKQLHKRSGLTVSAYADELGLSRKLMSDVLNGKVRATDKTFMNALRIAKLTLDDLIVPTIEYADDQERILLQMFRMLNDEKKAHVLWSAEMAEHYERTSELSHQKRGRSNT